jgi:hypothetical protein
VRRLGAVELQAGDVAQGIHRIGHVHDVLLDVGLEIRIVRAGGAQEEIAAPERAQVEVELALRVDEQGATAFLLQHGAAVRRFQVEVGRQVGEIAPVGLRAEVGPAAQAAQGQLGEQLVDMAQHRPQAAGRGGRQLVDEGQVAAQQLRVAQAPGRGRQAAEHQGDDLAGGHGRKLQCRAHAVADDVLAAFLGHQRHLLQIGNDQVTAPTQIAQRLGALQVVLQARRRHDVRGLDEGVFQDVTHLVCGVLQDFFVVFQFDAHMESLQTMF